MRRGRGGGECCLSTRHLVSVQRIGMYGWRARLRSRFCHCRSCSALLTKSRGMCREVRLVNVSAKQKDCPLDLGLCEGPVDAKTENPSGRRYREFAGVEVIRGMRRTKRVKTRSSSWIALQRRQSLNLMRRDYLRSCQALRESPP